MKNQPLDQHQITAADGLDERIDALRSLTLEQRGRLIMQACRAAARIEQGRRLSDLAPSQPAPWPQSTLEFLRSHARRVRQRPTDT